MLELFFSGCFEAIARDPNVSEFHRQMASEIIYVRYVFFFIFCVALFSLYAGNFALWCISSVVLLILFYCLKYHYQNYFSMMTDDDEDDEEEEKSEKS